MSRTLSLHYMLTGASGVQTFHYHFICCGLRAAVCRSDPQAGDEPLRGRRSMQVNAKKKEIGKTSCVSSVAEFKAC